MISENLSIILKYAGSILAGFYGIYATLTNFRTDKNGKNILTLKGYIGISVLFASTILSLSTNAIKDLNDHRERLAAAEAERTRAEQARAQELSVIERLNRQLSLSQKNSADLTKQLGLSTDISDSLGRTSSSIEQNAQATRGVLLDTKRLLDPLRDVTLSFWITIPTNNQHLTAYKSRLDSAIRELMPQLLSSHDKVDNVRISAAFNGEPFELRIDPGSKALPNQSEPAAEMILGYADLDLDFFKNPVDPKLYGRRNGPYSPPDLSFSIETTLQPSEGHSRHEINYILEGGKLELSAIGVPSSSRTWSNNGKLLSVPDLVDSQLIIRLPNSMFSKNSTVNHFLFDIRRELDLASLTISLADGREFRLQSNKSMIKYVDDQGFPFWIARPSKARK